jgi:hypothetical protein
MYRPVLVQGTCAKSQVLQQGQAEFMQSCIATFLLSDAHRLLTPRNAPRQCAGGRPSGVCYVLVGTQACVLNFTCITIDHRVSPTE